VEEQKTTYRNDAMTHPYEIYAIPVRARVGWIAHITSTNDHKFVIILLLIIRLIK
jgi:hypothetical protein